MTDRFIPMPVPLGVDDATVDRAVHNWASGDLAAQAVADIIRNTHVRDDVLPYLDWSEDQKYAAPRLERLLADEEAGKTHLSSTALFLVRLCQSLRGRRVDGLVMGDLWRLDPGNRQAVLRALRLSLSPRA